MKTLSLILFFSFLSMQAYARDRTYGCSDLANEYKDSTVTVNDNEDIILSVTLEGKELELDSALRSFEVIPNGVIMSVAIKGSGTVSLAEFISPLDQDLVELKIKKDHDISKYICSLL